MAHENTHVIILVDDDAYQHSTIRPINRNPTIFEQQKQLPRPFLQEARASDMRGSSSVLVAPSLRLPDDGVPQPLPVRQVSVLRLAYVALQNNIICF